VVREESVRCFLGIATLYGLNKRMLPLCPRSVLLFSGAPWYPHPAYFFVSWRSEQGKMGMEFEKRGGGTGGKVLLLLRLVRRAMRTYEKA